MYIDPKFYNYKYLDKCDKEFIDGMWWTANEVIPYVEDFEGESETINKITSEIKSTVISNIRDRIGCEIAEVIVSMLDNMETEDYDKRKESVDAKQKELGDIQIGDVIYDADGECYGKVKEISTNEGGEKCYTMENYLCPVEDFNEDGNPILVDNNNTEHEQWLICRKPAEEKSN